MEIVETVATGECCLPPAYECERRSYWLRKAEEAQPVLLTEDCAQQTAADSLGIAVLRIAKCDLVINYTQLLYDQDCLVRTIGVHLDTLQLFSQAQGIGTDRKGRCQTAKLKPIRLPRGKGVPNSPLVRLDSSTVEEEREHARAMRKAIRHDSSVTSEKTPEDDAVSPKAVPPQGKAEGKSR
jgi:hypothetical protein